MARVTLTDQALGNLAEHCDSEAEHFTKEGDKKTAKVFSGMREELLKLACREQTYFTVVKD